MKQTKLQEKKEKRKKFSIPLIENVELIFIEEPIQNKKMPKIKNEKEKIINEIIKEI